MTVPPSQLPRYERLLYMMKPATDETARDTAHRHLLYHLAADCLLQPPSRELLSRIASPDAREAVRASIGQEAERLCSCGLREANVDLLPAEYAGLFVVPGPQQTFPYETCYRERRSGQTMGLVALQVQRAYAEWRMPPDLNADELPDHAGVELRFMARLTQAEFRSRNASTSAFTRTLFLAQTTFLAQHILQWFPEWLKCVRECARQPFYRTFAVLLASFLESEKQTLGLAHTARIAQSLRG